MKYSSIPLAQTIVQHCQAKDISNIVISPGSRNAPLTISFTENPFFNCFSIVDERCAAFFALGMAQQLCKPVALVCTSGSALLNYYPAIAEAFYSQIPLVIISADRPAYKIDIGDGQTIRQDNVFDRHIGYSANLKQDVTHATSKIERYSPQWITMGNVYGIQTEVQSFNDDELNSAINLCIKQNTPVHINAPFEEPLYDFLTASNTKTAIKFHKPNQEAVGPLDEFIKIWHEAKRKIVLVGVNSPNNVDSQLLDKLGNDPTVLVFTETTSNLYHPNFFASIDTILAPIELSDDKENLFEELKPEIVLTFGGLIVSKKIKAFLRTYAPDQHWHVGGVKANDTFFCLKRHFKLSVNEFITRLYANQNNVSSNYFERWDKLKNHHKEKREEYLAQIPFSDFLVYDIILKKIPKGHQLQLSNSSTVRYAQLFDLEPTLRVFCNRGTSGIDGSTSTAIGASLQDDAPTLLITGDLSFFYDSNALWNNYIRKDFRIILINNGGGGIFRILPGKEDSDNFERYFETKHDLNARSLCAMYGLIYNEATDEQSLRKELQSFYEVSDDPKLLEIFTPRLLNNKILMDYFHFIS
ncbi:2-succinyl-5-enolpyruvyl-6-hydroxy-3-cyclohexene-1-carboxylic-acid synthase [Maribacter aestuarii]|uniref:2-succinyl-5-enolpyruvyl-6-hydroxy-3- cyclohexene-1-carboxylic-acid synthase n=1 Tax=Maribacter aestuarii TaxID=1130723 RepID=UPI0025A66B8C|nr:2-succinyl-5-enolpyruvyl-6-hydroxy-3-cyclohexene-1-carboxylic-acid synthase [Maribacter aestuarii]